MRRTRLGCKSSSQSRCLRMRMMWSISGICVPCNWWWVWTGFFGLSLFVALIIRCPWWFKSWTGLSVFLTLTPRPIQQQVRGLGMSQSSPIACSCVIGSIFWRLGSEGSSPGKQQQVGFNRAPRNCATWWRICAMKRWWFNWFVIPQVLWPSCLSVLGFWYYCRRHGFVDWFMEEFPTTANENRPGDHKGQEEYKDYRFSFYFGAEWSTCSGFQYTVLFRE